MLTCPACNSTQDKSECFMGVLGLLNWFRCRYCGMQWSKKKRVRKKKPTDTAATK